MPAVVGRRPGSAATARLENQTAGRPVGSAVGLLAWNQLLAGNDAATSPSAPLEAGSRLAPARVLVAPFIASPSTQPQGGAASFARDASPTVIGRSSDVSTERLVTALSAAASRQKSDRLSMADLTLISIASAKGQVAASREGSAPAVASPEARRIRSFAQTAARERGGGLEEVDRVARLVLKAIRRAVQLRERRGGGGAST